jgi:hypothetical protein
MFDRVQSSLKCQPVDVSDASVLSHDRDLWRAQQPLASLEAELCAAQAALRDCAAEVSQGIDSSLRLSLSSEGDLSMFDHDDSFRTASVSGHFDEVLVPIPSISCSVGDMPCSNVQSFKVDLDDHSGSWSQISSNQHFQRSHQDIAMLSLEDLIALKDNLMVMQSHFSSAQTHIFTLENRIADLEGLNHDILEDNGALADRVKLLEKIASAVGTSRGFESFAPETKTQWQKSASDRDELVKNINFISFCTAAADISRSSCESKVKEVQLLHLISSFLVHTASEMHLFSPEVAEIESGSHLETKEIVRYQAMNSALCAILQKLNAEACSQQPDGWC